MGFFFSSFVGGKNKTTKEEKKKYEVQRAGMGGREQLNQEDVLW